MFHPLVPGRAVFSVAVGHDEPCDVLSVSYPIGRAKYTIRTDSGVDVTWVDAEMLEEES